MSEASYREAAARYRRVLGLLGEFRGPCEACGHPDARHEVAEAIAGAVVAGNGPLLVADNYLLRPWAEGAVRTVHEVTIAVLAAHPLRHRMTSGRAAGIDREVWAEEAASSAR